MSKNKAYAISIVLVILAIFMMAIGGLLDISGEKHIGPFSKYHMWADGTFLLVLSFWPLLIWLHD